MSAADARNSRLLETFAIDKKIQRSLAAKGFKYAGEIYHLTPEKLSNEASIDVNSAAAVLALVKQAPQIQSISAIELLEKEEDPRAYLYTDVRFLRELFGGKGIPTGCITEIYGQSGSGKTRICMSMALSSVFDLKTRSLKYRSIYIDTEGGLCANAINNMAVSMCNRENISAYSVKEILSRIHYFRILDMNEQISLIKQLDSYISSMKEEVKLVIIDTVSINFRMTFIDMKGRASLLSSIIQDLRTLAYKHSIAILVTNHVTMKFLSCPETGCAKGLGTVISPALGEGWASAPNHRVLLYFKGYSREARMVKSSHFGVKTATFSISDEQIL